MTARSVPSVEEVWKTNAEVERWLTVPDRKDLTDLLTCNIRNDYVIDHSNRIEVRMFTMSSRNELL